MSDSVAVQRRIDTLEVSPRMTNYSKVVIHVSDDVTYTAGNDSGQTLEVDNPFGTQQMARDMLARLSGFQYQPYKASKVILNPAAEIGDALNATHVYGGIYSRSKTFSKLMEADVAAPKDEEINHEYVFEDPLFREFQHQTDSLRASLRVTNESILSEVQRATAAEGTLSSAISQTADSISAKVSSTGGNASSFKYTLTSSNFVLTAKNKDVFKATQNGVEIDGKITAASGKIANFDIGANALQYNGLNYGDTNKSTGAYIGSSGIQLGKNFKVSNQGVVDAYSLRLKGNITFLNSDGTTAGTMTAASLQQGAARANSGYSTWNGTSSTVSSNAGTWTAGAMGGIEYQSNFVYDENLGALRYRGNVFYANEIRTASGYNGRVYLTDAYGAGGGFKTLYYRTLQYLAGGALNKELNMYTGQYDYSFRPTWGTMIVVSAA